MKSRRSEEVGVMGLFGSIGPIELALIDPIDPK